MKPALGAEQLTVPSFQRPARWFLVAGYYVFLWLGAAGGPAGWVITVAIYAPIHLLAFDLVRQRFRHDPGFALRIWAIELPADIALILAVSSTLDSRFALAPIVALASIFTASMMLRAPYVMALAIAAGAGVAGLWASGGMSTDGPTAAFVALILTVLGIFAAARADAESQLRPRLADQARWLAFSEHAPAGMALLDRHLRIAFANSHPASQALVAQLESGTLADDVAGALHGAVSGETPTVVFPVAESFYELSCFPAEHGAAAIMLDVTKRLRAEAEALEAERRYQTVVESSADGIVIVSAGRVVFANAAAVTITGYQPEEFGDWTRLVTADSRDQIAARSAQGTETGVAPSQTEVTVVTKDGRLRIVEARIATIPYEGGPAVLATLRDITERREMEEELRRSQKMEAVGRLAGGIAHDFNNNLTVISGYSDLCLYGLEDTDPAREFVEQIQEASVRASELVGQLMNFSRHTTTAPQTVDLNDVVERTISMLGRTLGDGIECETDLAAEHLKVTVDRAQLEQAIVNLCVNARDAMPDGGRLTVSTRSGLQEGSPVNVLSISDTGAGMTDDVQEHLFEPFFTTKEEGTGLGLSSVYGVVTDAGASIDVVSAVAEGTTFKITLPAATSAIEGLAGTPAA